MAEHLIIHSGDKEQRYAALLPQLTAIVADETDAIANMANVAACLWETFRFWWVGFYRVRGGELVLGPFQGPLACTRIQKGRGVCGTAWAEGRTIIVPDVDAFPGHIACSSASRSEIVVPIMRDGAVVGVIDIDSERLNAFDETDALWLERIAALMTWDAE
jgi:GAF domain-containing protein